MVEQKTINDKNKLLSSLGLAFRARKLTIGLDIICNDIRAEKIKLVILTTNLSDNSKKKISNCSTFYNVEMIVLNITKEELGDAFGKSDIACIGVSDSSFVKLIKKYID